MRWENYYKMAIRDITRKPYPVDNDSRINIGLDLPIRRDDATGGFFATTSTTIEAVKNNIRNLLNTNQGERLMQPNLGTDLRQNLFEPNIEDTIVSIQNNLLTTFQFWLPFVEIRELDINPDGVNTNSIKINLIFSIVHDPNTLESIQLDVPILDSVEPTEL